MNERVFRATPEPDVVILRALGGERRLIVTAAQAVALTDDFAQGKTVPEVLVRTIAEKRCPPLREFYELVVQAHAADILVAGPTSRAEPQAIRWPVRFPAPFVTMVVSAAAVVSAGSLALALPHWRGPDNWLEVVAGWLLACALLSLGQLLAGCVIAHGAQVRATGLFWRTRFPHFRLDTTEAMMGGRTMEVAVAALRATPVLIGAAIVAWKAPGWLSALSGGALYVLAPFGDSAARQWLASWRRTARYSIRTDFIFEPVRADLWTQWTARGRAWVAEFGWRGVAWSVVWSAWMVEAFLRCMPKTAATLSGWIQGAPRPVHLGAEYLLLAAIGLGLLVSAGARVQHWLLQRAWAKPLRGADAREPHRPPLAGEGAEVLATVALFRDLDPASRAAIFEAMETLACARGAAIVREDDPGDEFYLIVEGEVEVRKRLPQKRRSVTIGWLGPGDGFGEIALLENTARTATIVASRPTRLLKLGRPQFERLVVGPLGAARVRDLLQHARFLGRLTFTAGWPFAELITFARRCRSVRAEADGVVLQQGEPNHWFYLVYDGAFEARDGARVLRRMGPGDYFGEISLLEGWEATATVVAIEESRCLTLSRADFLELFARDFRIGLRMEALADQRLGGRMFAARV